MSTHTFFSQKVVNAQHEKMLADLNLKEKLDDFKNLGFDCSTLIGEPQGINIDSLLKDKIKKIEKWEKE